MPASLQFRDVAIRTLTAAAHLIGGDKVDRHSEASLIDLRRGFDAEFISAFSEIFNNISIHAYGNHATAGVVKIEISPGDDHLLVVIHDSGKSFDIDSVKAPELEALPEGGMGIHIARSCLDELVYTAGPPNEWRLTKYLTKNGI